MLLTGLVVYFVMSLVTSVYAYSIGCRPYDLRSFFALIATGLAWPIVLILFIWENRP